MHLRLIFKNSDLMHLQCRFEELLKSLKIVNFVRIPILALCLHRQKAVECRYRDDMMLWDWMLNPSLHPLAYKLLINLLQAFNLRHFIKRSMSVFTLVDISTFFDAASLGQNIQYWSGFRFDRLSQGHTFVNGPNRYQNAVY